MSARNKLNQAYFMGSLLMASIAGYSTESWVIFGIALFILVALNLHSGEIRSGRR